MKEQSFFHLLVAGTLVLTLSERAWAEAPAEKEKGKETVEAAASPSPSPAPVAAPPVKINGFLQAWLDAGNSPSTAPGKDYNLSGDPLRHFRIKVQAEPMPGVQVVLVPELAGGFALLDGYTSLDFNQVFLGETQPGEISITAGQFKTPFGLNRMYLPTQLVSVEYSTISNAVFGDKTFWDDGLMATYKGKDLRVDLAAVKGLGPNLFTAPFNLANRNQDYMGRVEVPLLNGQLALGGSYYYGYHFSAPGTQEFTVPKQWFGVHLKLKGSSKTYDVEAEIISRENEALTSNEMFGINAQAALWIIPNLQPFLQYEYVENHLKGTLSTGRMGGGLNWYPRTSGPVRVTLEIVGESLGYSAGDPGSLNSGKAILQTQVVF